MMLDMGSIYQIVTVVIAFSALIFVHELGHYLAARLVGVRVERFFLGFDIGGMALKKKIGECEYGIGILPLGGYVKLAGQADDPREEVITGAPDELRSKPLWAQGLVFVAGVLMNMIFGFVLLTFGYLHGIPFAPAVVGEVIPNSPADVRGLQTGDRIQSINGERILSFEAMRQHVAGHPDQEMLFNIERKNPQTGNYEPMTLKIMSERSRGTRGNLSQIGVQPPVSRTIGGMGTATDELAAQLRLGDEIISVNGTPIPDEYHGHLIVRIAEDNPGKTLPVEILRDGKTISMMLPVDGGGLYDIGLRFYIPVTSIAPASPAEEAGLRSGDEIYAIQDGEKKIFFHTTDDMIEFTKSQALRPVTLKILRKTENAEQQQELEFPVTPRFMGSDTRIPTGQDTFLGILAQKSQDQKQWEVKEVLENGPAAGILQPGDVLVQAGELVLSAAKSLGRQIDEASSRAMTLLLKRKKQGLLTVQLKPRVTQKEGTPRIGIGLGLPNKVAEILPNTPAATLGMKEGDRLRAFTLSNHLKATHVAWITADGEEKDVVIDTPTHILADPTGAGLEGRFTFQLKLTRAPIKAESFTHALSMAGGEVLNMSMAVYNFLHKLVIGSVSIKAAGGPILLFQTISTATEVGFWYVIYLVAFISVNLAVFNLLPFPVLDGGHCVFLIIEWIKGSPPSIRVREVAQYIGIFCLLGLMAVVTGFDIFYSIWGS